MSDENTNKTLFKKWVGGYGAPLPMESLVTVLLRSGEITTDRVKSFEWTHTGNPDDIIAYRANANEHSFKTGVQTVTMIDFAWWPEETLLEQFERQTGRDLSMSETVLFDEITAWMEERK